MTLRTPRHALPYIQSAQAQKHITHNEALQSLDAAINCAVLGRHFNTPPTSPSLGDCCIVGETPGDAFAGRAGQLAAFNNGAWTFHPVFAGYIIFDLSESAPFVFDGTQWTAFAQAGQSDTLGVNTAADSVNRLAVKSSAILMSADEHVSGDVRLNINRAGPNDTASIIFQTEYTGLVETGLMGDGHYRIKVSPDGAAFRSAFEINPATGHVGLGTSPNYALDILETLDGGISYQRLLNPSTEASSGAAMSIQAGNGQSTTFLQYASGAAYFYSTSATVFYQNVGPSASQRFFSNSSEVLRLSEARSEVFLPFKLAGSTLASLPSAQTAQAGALMFVADGADGPALVFSDGSEWRYVKSNAPVS